jgi:hypothetical protein
MPRDQALAMIAEGVVGTGVSTDPHSRESRRIADG